MRCVGSVVRHNRSEGKVCGVRYGEQVVGDSWDRLLQPSSGLSISHPPDFLGSVVKQALHLLGHPRDV